MADIANIRGVKSWRKGEELETVKKAHDAGGDLGDGNQDVCQTSNSSRDRREISNR
jgi:hypothetical protein